MCVNRARTGLWGPGAGNRPGLPGRYNLTRFTGCRALAMVAGRRSDKRIIEAVNSGAVA